MKYVVTQNILKQISRRGMLLIFKVKWSGVCGRVPWIIKEFLGNKTSFNGKSSNQTADFNANGFNLVSDKPPQCSRKKE